MDLNWGKGCVLGLAALENRIVPVVLLGDALHVRCRQRFNLSHLDQACFVGINRDGIATSNIYVSIGFALWR